MLQERLSAFGRRAQRAAQPSIDRAQAFWGQLNPPTRALPSVVTAAIMRYFATGGQKASSLAYYAIFSLFPLALLLAVGFSRIVGPTLAQQQITLALSALLPPNATDAFSLIQVNIQQALEQSASFTIIAVIGLMWAGTGLFSGITSALDAIFHTPTRSIWKQRLIALLMTFVLLILLGLSFVSSALIRLFSTAFAGPGSFWLNVGAILLPVGLSLLIFVMLFRFVPSRRVHWDAVWPAALVGAIGWEIAKSAFGWYLTNVANYQFVYGTLATGIILLFWAFLIASLFLVSAELCAGLNEWYIQYFLKPDEPAGMDSGEPESIRLRPGTPSKLPG